MNSVENNYATSNGAKPDSRDMVVNRNELPDSDTIKMFVGQIPKNWDEVKLKEFFEQFGPVYHLNILKDKQNETSRGCCFVTYYHRKDAINAQNELHNIYLMPGLSHPVQMKPADIENRNDRKLFIGMLSKSMNENDIRELFKEFGQIETCSVLRENGKSKGCAFLTFVNRSCAQLAIRKMNQSQIFEGCNKPLVVKFADIGKDKNSRKSEDSNIIETASIQKADSTQQIITSNKVGIDTLNNLLTLLQQPAIIPLLESVRVLQQLQTTSSQIDNKKHIPSTIRNNIPTQTQPAKIVQQTIHSQYQHQQPILTAPTTNRNSLNLAPGILLHQSLLTAPNSLAQNLQTFGFCLPNPITQISPSSQLPYMLSTTPPIIPLTEGATKNFRGPEGCNLFIYHLPQEFTDDDLYSLFTCFGSILSAKVFIDKQTNLSKCFGFVSFANESAAQNAISGMNGFQIGNKRLKVQLKRTDVKPYDKPN